MAERACLTMPPPAEPVHDPVIHRDLDEPASIAFPPNDAVGFQYPDKHGFSEEREVNHGYIVHGSISLRRPDAPVHLIGTLLCPKQELGIRLKMVTRTNGSGCVLHMGRKVRRIMRLHPPDTDRMIFSPDRKQRPGASGSLRLAARHR
jgi:hypothetical protein